MIAPSSESMQICGVRLSDLSKQHTTTNFRFLLLPPSMNNEVSHGMSPELLSLPNVIFENSSLGFVPVAPDVFSLEVPYQL